MADLTGLTQSVSSAWTNNASLFLYCYHDDADYKITPDDLTQVLGRDTGAVLGGKVQGVDSGTDTPLEWGSIYYEEGAGWTNFANSPTLLIAPFDGVVQLEAYIRPTFNPGRFQISILKNNTFANTPYPTIRAVLKDTETRNLLTPPIAAVSGDYFTCVIRPETVTSTIGIESSFGIRPLGWL